QLDLPLSPICINDHSSEVGTPGVVCDQVEADPGCVNRELELGKYIGRWAPPFNDCQTFAADVIEEGSTAPDLGSQGASGAEGASGYEVRQMVVDHERRDRIRLPCRMLRAVARRSDHARMPQPTSRRTGALRAPILARAVRAVADGRWVARCLLALASSNFSKASVVTVLGALPTWGARRQAFSLSTETRRRRPRRHAKYRVTINPNHSIRTNWIAGQRVAAP